ncbi:MAG: twin-arginine translocase subunit TatB [Paracoccus denitrificans]|nr:MAG: twin-arginine translocase subunit TatB [Paracoccus denitrificans]PZO85185.1 MAG: twin-arginine translocase subunit TatB [Paracoccus denitrificans]
MFPDVGWTELLLIGIVALVVIGPKDLPAMFHALGRITSKARGMAREFSSAMEDAAKTSGMGDVQKTLRDASDIMSKPRNAGIDALTRAADRFEKWDPKVPTRSSQLKADPSAPPDVADLSDDAPRADVTSTTAAQASAAPAGPKLASAASAAAAPTLAAGAQPDVASSDDLDFTVELPEPTAQRRLHAVRRSDRT